MEPAKQNQANTELSQEDLQLSKNNMNRLLLLFICVIMILVIIIGGVMYAFNKGNGYSKSAQQAIQDITSTVTIVTKNPTKVITPTLEQAQLNCQKNIYKSEFSFIDENLQLCTDFLPNQNILKSMAVDGGEVVEWVQNNPYSRMSLHAIAFGKSSQSEGFPIADENSEETYKQILTASRNENNGQVQEGPEAILFNRKIKSIVSSTTYTDTNGNKPGIIVEWIVIFKQNVLVVRASKADNSFSSENKLNSSFVKSLSNIKLILK